MRNKRNAQSEKHKQKNQNKKWNISEARQLKKVYKQPILGIMLRMNKQKNQTYVRKNIIGKTINLQISISLQNKSFYNICKKFDKRQAGIKVDNQYLSNLPINMLILNTKSINVCLDEWFKFLNGFLMDSSYCCHQQIYNMKEELNQPFLNQSEQEHEYEAIKPPLGFFGQSSLLIQKNLILTFKNPKNLIFLIITPFILSLFMGVFTSLAEDNSHRTLENPPLRPVPPFPHCIGNDCVSLEYAIITDATDPGPQPTWVTNTIKYIQAKSGLETKTLRKYSKTITTLQDLKDYHKNFETHPNITQIGVLFCGSVSPDPVTEKQLHFFCDGSKDYSYYMVLNKTDSLSVIFHDMLEPLPIDQVAVSLKLLIDNAIFNDARLEPESQQMRINYTTSQYPVAPNRYLQNYDIVSQVGAFYYMITPLFAFLFIQSEIVREKEYKLRQGLNIFGASHSSYWISWFVIGNIYALVSSISTYLAGLLFGFGFFKDTPFYILIFFMMYPFTLAMQMMSFFLATLSPTLKAANAISYGIVLFAIVVESFVANNSLLVFLFADQKSSLITFLQIFLTIYPPFSYTKIFTNITEYSGYHFNMDTRKWEPGDQPYTIQVFGRDKSGDLPFGGGTYTRYSDAASMGVLFGDALFFIILAWYFDHVVQSNRGRGDSVFFPIKNFIRLFNRSNRGQWKRRVNPDSIDDLRNPNFLLQDQQESTLKEKQRVYKNSEAGLPALGLRIKGLSKTFAKMCSKNRVEAIKNFNLEIEPNELMGILGHNGAGKTTLINILTGVINPDDTTELEIIINNKSIERIDEIRKYIGVCSQFDILWNEMTAYEHLKMFARLKNIDPQEIENKIDTILGFVNLSSEKHAKVNSFSGGMKRRLSLAISAIGNPRVIFLDQPTTGLDPKVRQQIWELIQKLKKGKSIILTTHSMEEADILADRLSVMVKGKLKCVGTSLYLKQKYGDGHRVTLNIDDSKSKQVFRTIKKLFPKAIEVDCKGGNMIIGLNDFESLLDLIKMLENKQASGLDQYNLKQSIKDWNVSHSTLEEVFMKVTRESQE